MKARSTLSAIADRLRNRVGFEEFSSHQEALAASTGYEDERIVEIVSRKTQAMGKTRLAPVGQDVMQKALAISMAAQGSAIHVLELGGGCGAAFFELDRIIPKLISSWTIVETPTMASKASDLFGSERLRFESSLDLVERGRVDVIIAHGVLQYTSDPIAVLSALSAMRPDYLCIGRTLTTDGGSTAYLTQTTPIRDHGPGSSVSAEGTATVPVTAVGYESLLQATAATYRVVFELHAGPMVRMGSTSGRERGFVAVARDL